MKKPLQIIWAKVFKNGPSQICGRQPSKNFTWFILEYFVHFFLMEKKET